MEVFRNLFLTIWIAALPLVARDDDLHVIARSYRDEVIQKKSSGLFF